MEEPIEPKTLGTDIYVYQIPDPNQEEPPKDKTWLYILIPAVIVIIVLAILAI